MIRKALWPPVWTILHIALAFAASRFWRFGHPEAMYIGWVLVTLAIVIACWAALEMRRAMTTVLPERDPQALVTTGPFALSRNPIYAADCLAVVGFAFAFRQPFAAVLALSLGMILQARFIIPEEERLERVFGRSFQIYASKVRRWV